MRVVLVELTPYDPVAAAPVTLRLSSHDDVRACLLNGQTWWPALLKKGTFGIDLFDPTYSGRVQPGFGGIEFDLSAYPDAGRYVWGDKPAKVYVGTIGDAWPYTTRFDGLTVAATTDRGRVSVGLRVNDAWFSNPQLATYTGAGNSDVAIEGTADLKGRAKPLAIGQPKYVEPVPVDRVNNVYQFHAYGSAQGVLVAMDRLVRFPASVGNFASYSALVAAVVPRGRFATCLAQGLVRFGAPPDGVVSLLVQGDNGGPDGWVRTPGKVIKRLAKIAGAADAQIDAVSLAALDVAVPRNLSLYRTEQATVGDVVRRVAASCNGVAGISWLSKLFVARGAIGAPVLTLKSDGSALPQAGEPKLLEAGAPYHELRLQYDRCWRVHEPEEIAFTAPIVDLGDHVLGTVYREGNVVRLPADGKRYLYTNPTPTSGNAPPNVAFWSIHETAYSSSNLVGAVDFTTQVGGATKPEANATRTLPFDRLHRNTSFELFDGTNFPGWAKFGTGTIARLSAASAQDGQYLAVLNGYAGIESEQFPLSAGQTVYPVIRIACNAGTATTLGPASYLATLRLYPGDGTARFADLVVLNGALVGQAGFTTFNQGAYTIPAAVADLSGTGTNFAPRYASAVVVQDFGNAGSLASGLIDFFEIGAFEFGSTRSRVTRAAVAPANPTVNDLWVDTSVAPNVARTWSGAAWVASANLTTQGTHVGVDNGATNNAGLDLTLGGTMGDVVLTKGGANGSTTLTPLARIDRNLRSSLGLTLDDNGVLNAYGHQANIFSDPTFLRKASSIDWPSRQNDSFMVPESQIDGRRIRIDPNSGSCFLAVSRPCSGGERIDVTLEIFRAGANGSAGVIVNFFDQNGTYVTGAYAVQATAADHAVNQWLRRDGSVTAPLASNIASVRADLFADAAHTTGEWYLRKPVGILSPRAAQFLGANGQQIHRRLQRALLNSGGAHINGLSFTSDDGAIYVNNGGSFSIDTSDGYFSITGGAIGGLAAGTTYNIWANLPDQSDTGRTFSVATAFNGHTNADRVRIGKWATTSGGAGGGGSNNCVDAAAWIADGVRAGDAVPGTPIRLLRADREGWEWGEVEAMERARAPGVRLVTEGAHWLDVSASTPMELRDGSMTTAPFMVGQEVAVLVNGRLRWERVVRVSPLGDIDVARIHVGGRVYFAGSRAGAYVASHNPDKP